MPTKNHFYVVDSATLSWPSTLHIPSGRFSLLVAADTTDVATEVISAFAHAALKCGMVYFCGWGPGCERFHDIVDEQVVEDDLGERLFVGPNSGDTIMTTWHENDTLEEAVDFFINYAFPTDGFELESDYWLALCVGNTEWAASIRRQTTTAEAPE